VAVIREGDTVTVYARDATVLKIVGKKMRVKYGNGSIGHDYLARHELPDNCRKCGSAATHRVEVNAPGNGDCYAACEDCATNAVGRCITIHEERVVTNGGQTSSRTAIRDAVLDGVSPKLDNDAVRALEDVSLSATEAACLNRYPLLDFDEYSEIRL